MVQSEHRTSAGIVLHSSLGTNARRCACDQINLSPQMSWHHSGSRNESLSRGWGTVSFALKLERDKSGFGLTQEGWRFEDLRQSP